MLFGLLALVLSINAFAQMPQFSAEDMAKMRADRIKETCKTNDDQYKKYDEEQQRMRQGGGPGGFACASWPAYLPAPATCQPGRRRQRFCICQKLSYTALNGCTNPAGNPARSIS